MKVKFFDISSILFMLFVIIFLLYRPTHELFVRATNYHPYIMGFLKVAILATFGEILSLRLKNGSYKLPVGVLYRMVVWGFLGMCFVFTFELFFSGTKVLLSKGLLAFPQRYERFFHAFYSSLLMNLIFAPTFMALHRITDTFIEMGQGKFRKIFSLKISDVVKAINWSKFVEFVILKTIPLFWIPAHTFTFLLPSTYRVLSAALLSIILGLLLSLRK